AVGAIVPSILDLAVESFSLRGDLLVDAVRFYIRALRAVDCVLAYGGVLGERRLDPRQRLAVFAVPKAPGEVLGHPEQRRERRQDDDRREDEKGEIGPEPRACQVGDSE